MQSKQKLNKQCSPPNSKTNCRKMLVGWFKTTTSQPFSLVFLRELLPFWPFSYPAKLLHIHPAKAKETLVFFGNRTAKHHAHFFPRLLMLYPRCCWSSEKKHHIYEGGGVQTPDCLLVRGLEEGVFQADSGKTSIPRLRFLLYLIVIESRVLGLYSLHYSVYGCVMFLDHQLILLIWYWMMYC